jgi:hypothetical protein
MAPSSSLLVRVVVPSSTRCGAVPSSSWRVVVTVPSRSSGLASGRLSAVVECARRSPDDELARLEAVFGLARLGAVVKPATMSSCRRRGGAHVTARVKVGAERKRGSVKEREI